MNKYPFSTLLLALALVSSSPALDINPADGISDVYQEIYGIAPLDSDNDSDGMDYQTEAAFGTDPNTFDSSLLTTAWEIFSSTPTFTLKLHDIPGVRYELDESSDLLTWQWTGLSFSGDDDGEPTTILVPSNEPRFFWQTRGSGFEDSGDDELNDFEEFLLGTDIHSSDSDGDHVSDVDEFINHLHPSLNTDSDFDSLADDWENFHFKSLGRNGSTDYDLDGILDADEFKFELNPQADDRQEAASRIRYEYDFDRLTGVSGGGGAEVTYTYDAAGNIVSATVKP